MAWKKPHAKRRKIDQFRSHDFDDFIILHSLFARANTLHELIIKDGLDQGRQSTTATPFTSTTSLTSESSDIINCVAIYYEKGRSGRQVMIIQLSGLRARLTALCCVIFLNAALYLCPNEHVKRF